MHYSDWNIACRITRIILEALFKRNNAPRIMGCTLAAFWMQYSSGIRLPLRYAFGRMHAPHERLAATAGSPLGHAHAHGGQSCHLCLAGPMTVTRPIAQSQGCGAPVAATAVQRPPTASPAPVGWVARSPNLVSFPSKTGQDIFWAIRHYSLAIIHHAAGG